MSLILVVGAPRTGTWALGEILSACGAWKGTIDKHSGENVGVRDDVVRPFLRGISADPSGVSPLPDLEKHASAARQVSVAWRRRVEKSLAAQGASIHTNPVCIVSPPSLLLWPVWAASFGIETLWVVARRDEREVEKACKETGFPRLPQDEEGWRAWHHAHAHAMNTLRESGSFVREVWTSKLLREGEIDDVKSMVEWAGLDWDAEAVDSAITPVLWRSGTFTSVIKEG